MPKISLEKHQESASNYIATTPTKSGIIAHITGSGKSVTTIAGALKSYALGTPKQIVVATVSSLPEIQNDLKEHFGATFVEITNESTFTAFMESDKALGILKYGVLKRIPSDIIRIHFEKKKTAMYFDEAHELKNEATQIQTHVRAYRDVLEGLFLITATPVMSSAKDLQGLFWLLEPTLLGSEESFYKVFSNFKRVCYEKKGAIKNCRCGKFYVYDGKMFKCRNCGRSYEPRKVIVPTSYKNQDLLKKLVQPYIHSFFPPRDLRYYKINSALGESEKEGYNSIAQATLTNGEEQHSTRMIKLQYYLDELDSKKTLFRELVLKLKSKGVIIYADFHHTVDLIEEILAEVPGIEVKSITGKKNSKARKEVRDWFRKGAENKVLIITKAGGASLNLQATNNLIFYNIPFSVGNFIQVVGRVARYFSAFKHYNIFFPVVAGTLDDYKFSYVSSQKDLISNVLQNDCLPTGELEDYDANLLQEMRRTTLWNRK